jgi:integrase
MEYSELTPRPRNVSPEVAEEFIIEMVNHYSADTQQRTYTILKQAYGWCEERVKSVEVNPFEIVEKKLKEDQNEWPLETSSGRDPHIIGLNEAKAVVRAWGTLRWKTVQLIHAKYPRRAGGVSNLDIRDVNIDHPGCDWEVHQNIRRWDDHIIFRGDKRASEEGRNSGNKTKTDGKYPIDKELKQYLIAYLTIRPQIKSPDDPLLIGVRGGRLSADVINAKFRDHAKEQGYYYGKNDDDNLNPHYSRHWGTSWYEDAFGGDSETNGNTTLTDYMRGDSRAEIKALYNNYTERKRDRILDAMPVFHEPFIKD